MNKRSDKVWLAVDRLLLSPAEMGTAPSAGGSPQKSDLRPLPQLPRWEASRANATTAPATVARHVPSLARFPELVVTEAPSTQSIPAGRDSPARGRQCPLSLWSRNWALRVNGAESKLSEAAQNSGSPQASHSSVQSTLVIIRSKNLTAKSLTV